MTPGILPTTLYGMSSEILDDIIEQLRNGSFNFHPVRRVQISKDNGKIIPLTVTVAPPRDKLVQECLIMVLESIYEYTFLDCNHGFITSKSCHTALKTIHHKFGMANWIIEGAMAKCFDLDLDFDFDFDWSQYFSKYT